MGGHGLDLAGSGVGSCEHYVEPLVSIKCREFLD